VFLAKTIEIHKGDKQTQH